MTSFAWIGRSVTRIDAREKALGQATFTADLALPGTVHGRAVRSPHPHARVRRIDGRAALAASEVLAVVTAADIPGKHRYGLLVPDQPVLVPEGGKVRMVGDPVALVAARSALAAADACDLVDVEYEELPPVDSPEDALRAEAPLLHEERGSNVLDEYSYGRGDVAAALAAGPVVVVGEYALPRQEHAYLEPEAALAVWDARGGLTVYAGCQNPSHVRAVLAEVLAIAESKVRVVSPLAGGAFGGKDEATISIQAALLARVVRRPVRLVWSRQESLLCHPKRHCGRIRHTLAATPDGELLALEADVLLDGGAYASHSPAVLGAVCSAVAGPYATPNIFVRGKVVYTNNPISGAFRGYGQPQANVVLESQMDRLARVLKMDPVALRTRNLPEQGGRTGTRGVRLDSRVTLPETLAQAAEATPLVDARPADRSARGRGVAAAMPMFDIAAGSGMRGTGAHVEMLADGTARIRSGMVEIGSGASTMLCQLVAEVLGLSPDDVSIVVGDSATTPKSGPTSGSRTTYTSGNAAVLAARSVRDVLAQVASEKLEADPQMLAFGGGRVFVAELPQRGLTLRELAEECWQKGVILSAEGWFSARHAAMGHTFASAGATVEVDEETGQLELLTLAVAHDCGRVINPEQVDGQLAGAGLQGVGYALMEELPTPGGRMIAEKLSDCRIPTAVDAPQRLELRRIEDPYPTGPFGAKGVGEHALMVVAPAILNAIEDATGARLFEFPATSERLYWALRGRREELQGS